MGAPRAPMAMWNCSSAAVCPPGGLCPSSSPDQVLTPPADSSSLSSDTLWVHQSQPSLQDKTDSSLHYLSTFSAALSVGRLGFEQAGNCEQVDANSLSRPRSFCSRRWLRRSMEAPHIQPRALV